MSNASKAARIAAINEKIAKLQNDLAKIEASTDLTLEDLPKGTVARFTFGRAEKKVELVGTVVGQLNPPKGGSQVKFVAGEGYDTDVYTVSLSAVLAVVTKVVTEGVAAAE